MREVRGEIAQFKMDETQYFMHKTTVYNKGQNIVDEAKETMAKNIVLLEVYSKVYSLNFKGIKEEEKGA
jgi:hypothetical protein